MPSDYKDILELAVLEACEDELERLVSQVTREKLGQSHKDTHPNTQLEAFQILYDEISPLVGSGLKILGRLQGGIEPNYDHPWIPLLHASWYHLKHVNFLQKELAIRLKRHANSDEIRVMDFGCGTMPVMWAIALVLADHENELTHHKVVVQNYDTSEGMKALGCKMRTKLKETLQRNKNSVENERLDDAINRITGVQLDSAVALSNSDAHLLTAIHCLYNEKGCKEIRNIDIRDKCITLNQGKAYELKLTQKSNMEEKWSGNLEKIKKFRETKIGPWESDPGMSPIHPFLKQTVQWDKSNSVLVNL